MEGSLTFRQKHRMLGASRLTGAPIIGRPFVDPPPSTTVSVFVPSTALNTNQDTSAGMNIRVISTLSQKMGNEFRVTIVPAVGGDPLTCENVGVGRYAGDPLFPNMFEAPVEALYSGASGFTSQTTEQVSDWMPAGNMTGMEAGEKVVVSFNTGDDGEAGLRIASATNAETFFQTLPDNWDDPNTLGDGYGKVTPAKNYGVGLIETRIVGSGNYLLNPLGYQKSPPIIPAVVLATYLKMNLVAAGITKSSPIFLMTDSLVPVSVKKNLIAASFSKASPILVAPGSIIHHALTAAGIAKTSPTIGAASLVRRLDLSAAGLTKISPTLSAPLSGMKHTLNAVGFTRSATTFTELSFDDPANYANGEIAPEGYHWEFLTDDTGVRIVDELTGQWVVDLVAD